MSNTRSRLHRRAAPLALLVSLVTAPAALAQAQGDVDLKAISSYTLTMPKYKQYLDATVNMANVAAKNPQLVERLEGYGNQSLAEQIKLLESVPQARGAVTATGLTTRDFVLVQGALIQAGMAHAMTKGMNMPADSVIKKAGVSKANLEFYQKNEAEIGRLAKEAEARAPKLPENEDAASEGAEGGE